MKQKIGITLLIILNGAFIYLIAVTAILSYGLINGRSGPNKAFETANDVATNIFIKVAILSLITLLINYIISRMLIQNKRPIVTSIVITVIGIIASTPFYLSARDSFIAYQFNNITLGDYVNPRNISQVQLLIKSDTIPLDDSQMFIQMIGKASYQKGIWKYQKSIKILFKNRNGTKDSILSNGELFETSKGKFFKAEENIIEKYLRISNVLLTIPNRH